MITRYLPQREQRGVGVEDIMADATDRPALLAVEVVIRLLVTNGVLPAGAVADELERSASYTDDESILYMLARIARASRRSPMGRLIEFRGTVTQMIKRHVPH
jgi:hypothetical protein